MKKYCWMQYFDADTKKQSKSSEIKFADKHNHSAQPSDKDWEECLGDLVDKVNRLRQPPLAALSTAYD
ncbi:hypothetical protein Rleg10DRAFT_7161 [Rhizobium leguminosarum bv. trifolii WSM2012]|nr:hypothetical protein Rleg10DRAFT_7161 [Rhizobium leguminosarum bv. trifolii WSM2012]